MKNYDQPVKINHNLNWPYILYHPYGILIIGGSGSGKTYVLLNLVKHQQPDFDKIYLYVRDPFESKHQLSINGREKLEIENLKNQKAFIDYSKTIDNVYNPRKKKRVLIVFDNIIADMESNRKLSRNAIELFLRGEKFNISIVFISRSYFKVPKTIRLNATNFFIMKIPNKRELQQIPSNHSSDTDFKDFMKFYKGYTKALYSFLVNDTTLSSDNPLRFRKNLL